MDYNKHAHGRYVVCEDADKLSFGSFLPYRYEVPLEDIHTLFRSPHADAQPEGCPHDASIEVHTPPPSIPEITPSPPCFTSLKSSAQGVQKRVVHISPVR